MAVDIGVDTVLVETTLSSEKVKQLVEATGKQAVIRGIGSAQGMLSPVRPLTLSSKHLTVNQGRQLLPITLLHAINPC